MTDKEIEDIEREIRENDLDASVSSMVQEWTENRKSDDPRRAEIRNFVISSLEEKPARPIRTMIVRYSLSAAALIAGAILVFRILTPADPEKLFTQFYKPFKAVQETTRGSSDAEPISPALESYMNARYTEAQAAFDDLLKADPSSLSLQFFAGITAVATGDYEKAAWLLRNVADSEGGYSKDARWFLGLALLMTGDTDGAAENLKTLAGTLGYYSSDAAALLRRLE